MFLDGINFVVERWKNLRPLLIFVTIHSLTGNSALAGDVLLVGDSHTVGFFGQELFQSLSAKRYAVGGTNSSHWLNKAICPGEKCPFTYGYATPKTDTYLSGRVPKHFPGLAGLIEETNPSRIIIALGTNDACGQVSSAEKLAKLTQGKNCVWVGPPLFTKGPVIRNCGGSKEKYNQFVDRLKAAVTPHCRFVDSRLIRNANGNPIEADASDRVHFSKQLGSYWGAKVFEQLN